MTGDPSYARAVNKVFDLMCSKSPPRGLYPIHIRVTDGGFADRYVTFGALGDSFYEYLLKGSESNICRDIYICVCFCVLFFIFSLLLLSLLLSSLLLLICLLKWNNICVCV
jgi:hypothetical protein